MAKSTHRLNAIKVANVKAVGMHPDGAGLYLKVDKGGSKSWVFRYMFDRRQRYLGLGSAASVSLATARSLASDSRRQLDLGQDPIDAKRAAEKEAAADKARAMTFKECAECFVFFQLGSCAGRLVRRESRPLAGTPREPTAEAV